jgi:hypothetical protein
MRVLFSRTWKLGLLTVLCLLPFQLAMFYPESPEDGPVAVRHKEGLVHGFLVLRSVDGKLLATGDLIQTAVGDRVTSELIFRFKDGSSRSETTVFSQDGNFRLLSDHLIEKGPAFKNPTETLVDASTGEVTVHYADKDGKEKVDTDHMELLGNLANGLIFTLLKNIDPGTPRTTLSMIAFTPKPRLVKLVVTPQGDEPFLIGGSRRKTTHYVGKIEIGGVAGVVAPLIGKNPPDTHVWILGGKAPAFVKFEGALYSGGPIWRIELSSPAYRSTPN